MTDTMTDTNLITDANNLLDEAVELVEVTNEETYQEAYEPVMDAYPDVVLPASTIDAIHCNESLSALQEQI
jgi:AmiR/NasT family two-component response regulator